MNTGPVMEMLEDYCVYMVLRLGNFKMPAVAMEATKTLNLTQR
jgi:hypothetical protein